MKRCLEAFKYGLLYGVIGGLILGCGYWIGFIHRSHRFMKAYGVATISEVSTGKQYRFVNGELGFLSEEDCWKIEEIK